MRSAGGAGLGGLLLIVALLYFTKAGPWLMSHLHAMDGGCARVVELVGPRVGEPVCRGVAYTIHVTSAMIAESKEYIDAAKQWWQRNAHWFRFVREWDGTTGGLSAVLTQSLASMQSPGSTLQALMQAGPGGLNPGNTAQQLQHAIDSFSIGQQYITQGHNAGQALPWLQYGARQPQGFGVMSQLYLGDLYRFGGAGVAADPLQAQAYYRLAGNSLMQLSQNKNPQAQQLLQSLGTPPQALMQQIQHTVAVIAQGPGGEAE